MKTLYDKIWDSHVVVPETDAPAILYIDVHLIHEVTTPQAFTGLRKRGLKVRRTDKTFATMDHSIPTTSRSLTGFDEMAANQVRTLAANCVEFGVPIFDLNSPKQGIVHVIGPELGLTQPGRTLVCGDSHTSTHGAFGALAHGIGTSEVEMVLATQCLLQRKSKNFLVNFEGRLQAGVTAKDMILALIGHVGAAGGTGCAVEYAGSAIRDLPIEGRLTICNLSIELGAKMGMVAPDEKTFEFLRGRPYAPEGEMWEMAVKAWRELPSDADAVFDKEVVIDVAKIIPQVTWGISPEHVIGVDGRIPDPETIDDPARRAAIETALDYMGLKAGAPIAGTPVDWVFIGSCTNSRLSDLRAAAEVARGRKVAPGVRAWIVPGSENVKREAVAEGLDQVFIEAGFEWREPGCSMCLAANGETVAPGQRSVSTSNRNFVGRQGPQARTHLASPASAAAAAIAGAIADVRTMGR